MCPNRATNPGDVRTVTLNVYYVKFNSCGFQSPHVQLDREDFIKLPDTAYIPFILCY